MVHINFKYFYFLPNKSPRKKFSDKLNPFVNSIEITLQGDDFPSLLRPHPLPCLPHSIALKTGTSMFRSSDLYIVKVMNMCYLPHILPKDITQIPG